MSIVFTCGTTGGHVYPAIAIAQELNEKCLFICSENKEDNTIISQHNFPYKTIPISNKNILILLKGIVKAYSILKQKKASYLIATGGYSTFPVVLAAKLKGIKILLLEQNAIPGRVNRILQFFAEKVCLTFPESKRFFSTKKAWLTGNPIRKSYLPDEHIDHIIQKLADSPQKKLLIFGGSQGAAYLNNFILENQEHLIKNDFITILISGRKEYQKHYPNNVIPNKPNLYILPYVNNMKALYDIVTGVICRAGATSVCELLEFRKKAILVPYPFSKDNHQLANARYYESTGLGKMIVQDELNIEKVIHFFKHNTPCKNAIAENLSPRKMIADYIKKANSN